MDRMLLLSLVTLFSGAVLAEDVLFPSERVLDSVDESLLSAADREQLEDPLNTGTPLFRASTPLDDNTQLSRNFLVRSHRYAASESDYFRAHPALFDCLQAVYDDLLNTLNKELQIVSGYLTKDELGASAESYEVYARTGCGVVLNINQASNDDDDVQQIADAVMTYCPLIFSREMRDIGLVAMADRLHLYMAAPDVQQPYFASIGYAKHNTAEFATWCQQQIDSSLIPYKLPECSSYETVASGSSFPADMTMDQACGGLDVAITRDSPDFNRLLQFLGSDTVIEDSESSSSWCGSEGTACPACGSAPAGNAAGSRCADRLMSYRLYNVIVSVHSLVNIMMNPTKLKILEAWDEAHSAASTGDSAADSIHREGRAAIIQLGTDNTAENLETLTQYALCSGADYVQNNGDSVTVAVKKQAGLEEAEVQFVMTSLLEVAAPSSQAEDFEIEVPGEMEPLFDADNQDDLQLGENCTVGDFKSSSTRYFRLHPALVKCYDQVLQYDEKWAPETEVGIEVVRGFLTPAEVDALYKPRFDKRRYGHARGRAMHLKYADGLHGGDFAKADTHYSAHRLMSAIILNCAPIFAEEAGLEMGIGLYNDGVYVDMRENFLFWLTDPDMLPLGESRNTIQQKYLWAVDYRMFNPDKPSEACSPGTPPLPKSPTYKYQHSGYVHARRRRRQTGEGDGNDCTPQTNTEHCDISEPFRNNEIAHVLGEVKRMIPEVEDRMTEALEKCLGTCGSCNKGEYWEEKIEHCNNFLHWMPFQLLNEAPDVTNLYYRGNRDMKAYACHGERHCVDKAPLFSIMAPSVEAHFRPDPKKSIEHQVYDNQQNPSAVAEVAYEIYGMHANGTVNVWVTDATEMEYLRASLKPIMAYNKAVTKVVVYVMPDPENESPEEVKGAVALQLNNMIKDWTTSICPSLARFATPPVIYKDIHEGISKRDLHKNRDFTEELAFRHMNYEAEWMQKTLR